MLPGLVLAGLAGMLAPLSRSEVRVEVDGAVLAAERVALARVVEVDRLGDVRSTRAVDLVVVEVERALFGGGEGKQVLMVRPADGRVWERGERDVVFLRRGWARGIPPRLRERCAAHRLARGAEVFEVDPRDDPAADLEVAVRWAAVESSAARLLPRIFVASCSTGPTSWTAVVGADGSVRTGLEEYRLGSERHRALLRLLDGTEFALLPEQLGTTRGPCAGVDVVEVRTRRGVHRVTCPVDPVGAPSTEAVDTFRGVWRVLLELRSGPPGTSTRGPRAPLPRAGGSPWAPARRGVPGTPGPGRGGAAPRGSRRSATGW